MTDDERLQRIELALAELAHIASAGMFGGSRRNYPHLAAFAREHEERRRLAQAAAATAMQAERAERQAEQRARAGVT